MRELGIDLSDRWPQPLTRALAERGRRRHHGLRRRLPLHPRQALPRLGPPRPKGRPLDEVGATRDDIAGRVDALIAELDRSSPPPRAALAGPRADATLATR